MRYCVGELPTPEDVLDTLVEVVVELGLDVVVETLDVVGVGLLVVVFTVVNDVAVVVPVATTHWSNAIQSVGAAGLMDFPFLTIPRILGYTRCASNAYGRPGVPLSATLSVQRLLR